MEVLLFTSRFCSKCHYTKTMLDEAGVYFKEIDIARSRRMLEKFRPKSVPTLIVCDKEVELFRAEGIPSSEGIRMLKKLL